MKMAAVVAVLALVWWLADRGLRANDAMDDAKQLARHMLKNGWRPLTRRDK